MDTKELNNLIDRISLTGPEGIKKIKKVLKELSDRSGDLSLEEIEVMINQALEAYSEAELQKAIENDYFVLDPGEETYAYGVLIDFTEGKSSPDLRRIGNPELHRTLPVQSQYKGCIWDSQNKQILYYLNPENWNLAVNDEINNVQKTAEEVANDLDVYAIRVETPKFYASSKVLATDGAGHTTMAKVMFSTIKLNASYIEIPRQVTDFRNGRMWMVGGEYSLIPCTDKESGTGGYCSTKNDVDTGTEGLPYPITNINRATARDLAHNGNTNLMCYEYYKWLFYWAFVIEYATLNSHKPIINELDENGFHQGGLGGGLTKFVEDNGISLQDTTGKDKCRYIGVTNELGNGTGELNIPTDTNLDKVGHPNRYRGFECPFGDIYLVLDGFLGIPVENQDGNVVFYDYYSCCNPEYFADEIPLPFDVDNDYSTVVSRQWNKIARYEDLNTNDLYNSDEGEGLAMGYITKYMSIGNRGEMMPQMWENEQENYFVNYFYVRDKASSDKSLLLVGSIAGDDAANRVGLGDFYANYGVSSANYYLGFRCFNIIQDDGTVI